MLYDAAFCSLFFRLVGFVGLIFFSLVQFPFRGAFEESWAGAVLSRNIHSYRYMQLFDICSKGGCDARRGLLLIPL